MRWFRSLQPRAPESHGLAPGPATWTIRQARFLSAQRAQFDFCNVEPTAVLRRVVDFQSLCQLAERVEARRSRTAIRFRACSGCPRPGPPARPPGIASPTCPRSTGPNPVACAARSPPHGSGRSVAPPAGRSARPRCAHTHARLAPAGRAADRQRLPHFSDQLLVGLVHADHRTTGVVRTGIGRSKTSSMQATNAALPRGGIRQYFFR